MGQGDNDKLDSLVTHQTPQTIPFLIYEEFSLKNFRYLILLPSVALRRYFIYVMQCLLSKFIFPSINSTNIYQIQAIRLYAIVIRQKLQLFSWSCQPRRVYREKGLWGLQGDIGLYQAIMILRYKCHERKLRVPACEYIGNAPLGLRWEQESGYFSDSR